MPGICGIIADRLDHQYIGELQLMTDAILKPIECSTGVYIDEELGVCAGWCVPRGHFSDCLPISNEKSDIQLLYFGENLTDLSVFNRLKSKNHMFDRKSASYLVHLYEEDDERFLESLNGFFAGIILDKRHNKTILFNDRFGMQRIYYHYSNNIFYFSSEAKAILAIRRNLRDLSKDSLAELIYCGCILRNKSLFPEIFTLPGAASWTFRNNEVSKDYYFTPAEWEKQTLLDEDFFCEAMKNAITTALPNYLRGEDPIGLVLENGVDVCVLLSKLRLAANKYPCLSYANDNDAKMLEKKSRLASVLSQPHHMVSLDGDFIENFEKYAEQAISVSEGSLPITASMRYYQIQKARQIAQVHLTGEFGNILFKRTPSRHLNPQNAMFLSGDFKKLISEAQQRYQEHFFLHPLSREFFYLVPCSEYGQYAMAQSQMTVRSLFHDNNLVALIYRCYHENYLHYRIGFRLAAEVFNPDNPAAGNGKRKTAGFIQGAKNFFGSLLVQEHAPYEQSVLKWRSFGTGGNYTSGRYLTASAMLFKDLFQAQLSGYIEAVLTDRNILSNPIYDRKGLENLAKPDLRRQRLFAMEIAWAITISLMYEKFFKDL